MKARLNPVGLTFVFLVFAARLAGATLGISSFSPTIGQPGDTVTINGSGFSSSGSIIVNFWQFQASPTVRIISDSQLTAVVPGGATTGPLSIQQVSTGNTVYSINSFTINRPSDLSVSMAATPNPVTATSNLVYTIVVANNSTNNVPNVRMTNSLPGFPTTVFLKAATSSQPGASFSTNSNPVVTSLGTLNANSSTTVTLTFAPQVPGTLTNTATVASDYTDPDPANNTASVTTTVIVPRPALSIQLLTNHNVQISWPPGFTNYVLESLTVLGPSNVWTTDTAAVSNVVVEPITNATKFYRLKQ